MNEQELKEVFQRKKAKKDQEGNFLTGFTPNVTFEQVQDHLRQIPEVCAHCGLTPQESELLFELQRTKVRNDATRGGRRGRRLELDRIQPELPYDQIDNLVWSCYWCNNAKTNFFSQTEFEPIGNAIGNALRQILQQNEQRTQ
jgi:hypothetical protein